MRLKVRKQNMDGEVRMETRGKIEEIRIREDFLHPGREAIELCFRGTGTSGIIEMSPKEFDGVAHEIRNRVHLVKSVKIVKD